MAVVPPSGTVPPPVGPDAAWKEKTKLSEPVAPGSDVEKLHVIASESRPFPLTEPIPSTRTPAGFPPWNTIWEEVRSNVKPPTLQRLATAPELKNQGEVNATCVPGAIPEKLPSSLITTGIPVPPGPVQANTSVAVPAEDVSNCTPPANVMSPVIGTA